MARPWTVVLTALACCASVAAFGAAAPGRRSRSRPVGLVAMSASKPALRVGIFGGGTVGGGIVEILEERREALTAAAGGRAIEVAAVVVRDAAKARDWALPATARLTESYADVLEDASIGLVVEVMGGTTEAKDIVFAALRAGKDVVTANKALIAAHLKEIEAVLDEVNAKRGKNQGEDKIQFGFEAAVCGGIPIIHALQTDFVGDEVTMLRGILNGCTNFMLTKMEVEGLQYSAVLAEASKLGYAEADPTLDVGGFDARSKLAILVRLAFGVDVDEDDISCKGITALKAIDFEYARDELGGTIKLLGVAAKTTEGKLTAYVTPSFVPKAATLASISDATNAVEIASANLGDTILVGRGAGRFPTANSCVSDMVLAAARRVPEKPFLAKKKNLPFQNDYESAFYLRIRFRNAVGIMRELGAICERHGVSIDSLLQKKGADYFVIIMESCHASQAKKVTVDVEATEWCVGDCFYMPYLTEA